MFKNLKNNMSKNNILIISFLIFISIPIIISISLLSDREWFDVMSILSVFYIGVPTLITIYKMNSKGLFKKFLKNFNFKRNETKKLTHQEIEKMNLLNIENNLSESAGNNNNNKNNKDIIFISIVLILYGLVLLICSTPSLIIYSMQ